MKAKFTPGPWIEDGDDIGVERIVGGETVFLTICHIENPSLYQTTDSVTEEAANRALILSAPKLYEELNKAGDELQEILDMPHTGSLDSTEIFGVRRVLMADKLRDIRAAIAAAEGGSI